MAVLYRLLAGSDDGSDVGTGEPARGLDTVTA
jgi:hypothetical protein